MRLNYLITCILIYSCLYSNDSLIRFSHLTFRNEVQKSEFLKIAQAKPADMLGLFLTGYGNDKSYPVDQARARIDDFIRDILPELTHKSDARKVKSIYRAVHDRFFRRYSMRNTFSDIFVSGQYNCVSGSALYAIIFEALGIPYQILEAPGHVFLIAYPQTHKIMVESTDPVHGYAQFSDYYIAKYLNALVAAKLITDEELRQSSKAELFRKFYFSSGTLSLRELAGLQFSNFGIYLVEDHQLEDAVSEFKRACYLNPGERQKFLLREAIAGLLNSKDYGRRDQFQNLLLLCSFRNLKNYSVNDELVYHEYQRVIDHLFNSGRGLSEYDAFFNQVHAVIADSVLRDRIAFTHHYEMARLKIFNLRTETGVFQHLQSAFRINPGNMYLHSLVLAAFQNEAARGIDLAELSAIITRYRAPFDFLDTTMAFNKVRAYCVLEQAYQYFIMKNENAGHRALASFEKSCAETKNYSGEAPVVEKAYTTAAAWHFKKGQKQQARALLERGLKFAPGNFALTHRLNMISN